MAAEICQKVLDIGTVLILILFPLALTIALIPKHDPAHPLISVYFSIADLLIGILFMLWLVKALIVRRQQVKIPPRPVLLFVTVALLSFVNVISMLQWLKEGIQMIEYFIMLYLLFENNLKSIRIATVRNLLLALTTLMLLLSLIQHSVLDADVYLVRGLFENRNVLGAFLCMTIPIIYADALFARKLISKLWMLFLLLLSYVVITSPSALMTLLITLGIVSAAIGRQILVRYAVVALLLIVVYPFVMPVKNVLSVKEFASVYEQGSISSNYYRVLDMITQVKSNVLLHQTFAGNHLEVSTNSLFASEIPANAHGNSYKSMDATVHVKNRYLEMQAALNLLADNTLLGVGLGNFQNRINSYYKELPKVNTAEPGQHSGYLLIGSTMGIIGLSAFLWMLFTSYKSSYRKWRTAGSHEDRIFFVGVVGSIAGCLIEGIFSFFLTASLLTPFVLLLYFSLRKESDAASAENCSVVESIPRKP